MHTSYDQLIAQIAELEKERQKTALDRRSLEHELEQSRRKQAELDRRIKTMQTLNLSVFTTLEVADIYLLACESLVHQLGWDTAFIITVHGNRTVVAGSYQATQKQLDSVHDYLGGSQSFREMYAQRSAFSTFHSTEPSALGLRSVFQTDELVAMPIQFAEQLFSYLIVCSHSSAVRSAPDLDFLSAICSQVAHAVQNSQAFNNLEAQNVRLRQLDEMKNSFISITSHQLRTPLSIIKWILSILQSDEKLTPLTEQLHLINQAYESNERLIRVVNNLLNVSRIEEGKLPFNPQLVDLKSLLTDMTENSKKAAAVQQIVISLTVEGDFQPLELDPLLFKEAVQNLLDNAISYNQNGGWVKVNMHKTATEIVITFCNSGPGISVVDQKKIFDQFYRSPEAMKMQPNGNGLGLYLSRAIIKEHGGELLCESKPGEQTTFTIILPLTAKPA